MSTLFRSIGLRQEFMIKKHTDILFSSWKKRLCRFYMISHGYLEYDSQKRFLRKFIFAMWCDFVLYFCLLFKQNAFVRPKNFCLLEAQKIVVHVKAYVMQISWTAGCDFYLLEKNINLVLFYDLTTHMYLLCTSFIGDLKLVLQNSMMIWKC